MNARFFDVKKSKQDAIINAALKIFTQNGYKKASTDVIVKEAGISKGLLFHYFISKKGLYEFICDYSVKYMTLELTRAVKKSEKDFFKVQVQIERARTRVMKNYPYMQQFLNNMKFETSADAREAIGDKCEILAETYNSVYCQTDNTKFLDKIDVNRIIDMLGWLSDGFIRDRFQNPDLDLDDMSEEYERYLNMLRRHFYKSPGDDLVSIARSEMVERDNTVMDQMKMDATFEERLEAGKQPQFEVEEAEETVEAEPENGEPEIAESEVSESEITKAEDDASDAQSEEEVKAEAEASEESVQSDTAESDKEEESEAIVDETEPEDKTSDNTEDVYEVSLPNWWTQSESDSESLSAEETDSPDVEEEADSSDASMAINEEPIAEETPIEETPVYEAPTRTPEELAAIEAIATYGNPIIGRNYNSNPVQVSNSYIDMSNAPQPVMAEIPVPADILHTTLENEEEEEQPWAPRPVRQIRL